MSLPITYAQVFRMVRGVVKHTRVAKKIARKAGLINPEPITGLPPGGATDYHLEYNRFNDTFFWKRPFMLDVLSELDVWHQSQMNEGPTLEPGSEIDPSVTPVMPLGFGPRRFIAFTNLRNPDQVPNYLPAVFDNYQTHPRLNRPMRPIANHRARQYFIWEDIPQGLHHYPLGLEFYIKKVDFGASLRVDVPVQVSIDGCLAEGAPDAEMVLVYSTSSRSGPWTEIAVADLAGVGGAGGVFRGPWTLLPTAAKADVWVSLMLRARSAVARLHMAHVSARARWGHNTAYWQPYKDWIA